MNTALISGIYGDKGVRCPNTKSLYFPALSIFDIFMPAHILGRLIRRTRFFKQSLLNKTEKILTVKIFPLEKPLAERFV